MRKRTKALAISPAVKKKVRERDDYRCVLCKSPYGLPEAHYIARSQSGLGIEENILTLCRICHDRYDNTVERPALRAFFREYLKGKYPDWDESKLIYKKEW